MLTNMSNLKNKQIASAKKKINKKHKIIIISIIAFFFIIALIIFFVSNQTTTVYLDFTAEGEVIYSGNIAVKGIKPTVLDAVTEFAKNNKISYTYDNEDNPTTIYDFGDYPETKNEEESIWYFWEFGINDITVYDITGRASNNFIKEGDEIHWYYSGIQF